MIEDVGFVSGHAIRCPQCGHLWTPDENIDSGVLYEGDNEVVCEDCDCCFLVNTQVMHLFSSPQFDGLTKGDRAAETEQLVAGLTAVLEEALAANFETWEYTRRDIFKALHEKQVMDSDKEE